MFFVGVLQAFGITFLIAFFNVYIRLIVQKWSVDPIVFTCLCLIVAAFILSLAAGPGRLVTETLKSKMTWIYSFVLIGAYIVDLYIVSFISGTEASFFSRMTIPISLFIAWYFFSRTPLKTDLIGASFVVFGLGWLIYLQPSDILIPVLLAVILSAIFQTTQYVIAETHDEAVAASTTGTIRDKARVVAFVTFVSSGVFLLAALALSILKGFVTFPELLNTKVPDIHSFTHPETIWAALFYGVFILPFIRYLKWSASYNIKAETLFAFMAFVPIVTYGLELLVEALFNFPAGKSALSSVEANDMIAIAVLMTFGAGLTAFLKVKNEILSNPEISLWQNIRDSFKGSSDLSIYHSNTAIDDYEIICTTLEYADGDQKKAAELLNITENTFEVLFKGQGRLALVEEESKALARRYRTNVTNRDALTGLLNRTGFTTEFKKQITKHSSAVLLFIDLNKFKPVNDTYGHEVGDFILMEAAKRLIKELPPKSLITRLGGDEFVVAVLGAKKMNSFEYSDVIKKALSTPFLYNDKKITIGGSVGIACYPEHGDSLESLLQHADAEMYEQKEAR